MLRTSDFFWLLGSIYLAPTMPDWLAAPLGVVFILSSFWFLRRGD